MKISKSLYTSLFCASLFVSCSNIKPKNEVVQDEKPVVKKKLSKHKTWANDARKSVGSVDTETLIAGSAEINPSNYDGKTYFLYGAEHLKLDNYYFDIPVVYNEATKKWIKYFLTRGRGFFERYSARGGRYAPLLGKILEDKGLPRDLIFLAMAESGFQNKAKSWARAVGPWQFMPYTGKRYGLKIDWYVDERRDPFNATVAAAKYLKKLYGDFGSWELAAAAYNAGEGKVGRAIRRYKTENFWNLRKGRYLKPETKNYVPNIMALAIIGKNLKVFGFNEIDFHDPIDFEEIKIPGGTDLVEFSKDMGLDFEDIQYLNPEILRWFTPPNAEEYTLRIPAGLRDTYVACCSSKEYKAVAFQEYQIRGKRTNLNDVARKFKIKKAPYVLSSLNGLSATKRLKKGSTILLPFREGQSRKNAMYADLYEKPRKVVVRRKNYRKRLRIAKARGKRIVNPSKWYVVRRGDSLWSVARKTKTNLDTLIVSNLSILNRRQIRAGDRLAIR
ncbi:putative membrane-bound lytic murein transglycosylase D precursor [Halobacteriovorax marinus SJ]|uniref:Membrane-bound lytic murein transglycosylase D n=1 Tax=Halobacteriovorax marinus (strain ATCC BAA-682 / DSM 15412 / SJ) TaxID=862908 RepID=E1WYU9_HALMS|nr:lytic transglycosylase domain-containing protein [Halobacteriovorax marinus]CBW27739.1 putative membrane-bound lytic murein transglycosylase D precursor [Halobacteriovorax marinus SJ]